MVFCHSPHARFQQTCLAVLISFPTMAQPEPVDYFQLSLQELMSVEVSVATTYDKDLRLSPSSVSVFTQAQINQLGLTHLEQLLNYVPGFDARREVFAGQGYALTARGRAGGQNSVDVLILYNGQRLNEDATGGAMQVYRNIALANIKQVEIIRGPGSALYGANAFTAVINLISDNTLNDVRFSLSEHLDNQLSINVSQDLAGWRHSFFSQFSQRPGHHYATSGSGIDSTTQDPSQQVQWHYSISNERTQWDLRYNRQQLDDYYLFGFLANGVNDYDILGLHSQLKHQLFANQQHEIHGSVRFNVNRNDGLVRVMDAATMASFEQMGLTSGTDAFVAGFISLSREWSSDLNWRWILSDRHDLTSGIEVREAELVKQKNKNNYELVDFIDVLVQGNAGTIEYYGDIRETSDSAELGSRTISGVYLQDDYRWNEHWHSTLGVRFDHYSDFGSATSPRLALLHKFNGHWQIKAMYGEAFRAPSPIEQTVKNSPAEVGNPNLQPELIQTTEVNVSYQSQSSQWALTGFENHIQDTIGQVPHANGLLTFENGEHDTSRGWEMEFSHQFSGRWQLISNYSRYHQLSTSSQFSTKELASVSLNWHRSRYNLNVNVLHRGNRQQRQSDNSLLDLGAYQVLNVHGRYRLQQGIELNVGINNLADKNIRHLAFSQALDGGVPQAGREAYLQLYWVLP